MSTTNLYCTNAEHWNWQFSDWDFFRGSYGGYSSLGTIGYIPQYTDGSSTAGILMFSFDSVPANATISSAVLHIGTVRYSGTSTHTVKIRVSSSYRAYTTSEPSNYQSSSLSFTTTLTNRSIDITSQMQSYATSGSPCYVYMYESNPSVSDYNNDDVQGIASSTPYIALEYSTTTACSAPNSVNVSNSTPPPSSTVTLSWSGATGGTNNSIVGYDVYYSTSAGGSYTYASSPSGTSVNVSTPSSIGSSYYFKVLTRGSAGNSFYSGLSSAYASVTSTLTACGAPTTVSISDTVPPPSSTVTLSWSGATNGDNNSITGYKIYRATTSGGTYSALTSDTRDVSTSGTSGSFGVTSPSLNGDSYYYKIKSIGSVSGYDSGLSTNYAGVTSTLTTACIAPTEISPSTATPGLNSVVTITWNAGTAGSNNSITGYLLYRDTASGGAFSTLMGETDSATLSTIVYSSSNENEKYYYRVKTKGSAGLSYYSPLSTAYAEITSTKTSGACGAPTTVTISEEKPEPSDSLTISWSGATAGTGNPITGYEIYEDATENGNFSTLTDTVYTSSTSGSASVTASSDYNITKYYKVKTIGTNVGYDSGLSDYVTYKTYLYADYNISIPTRATLPLEIQYIVVYYDSTNVYRVLDNTVLGIINKETILPCSGVFNDSTYHYYIVTAYDSSAYVNADKARALTESEQIFYLANGTVRTSTLIKQWSGSAWSTNISSNIASWSQTAASQIIQNANSISSKVSKGAIISEINQTAEEITINANKISLEGIVTANSYFKILSDGSMEAINGKFSGSLTAETTYCNNLLLNSGKEMTVGLWKIGSAGVYYPSGQGFNYLAFLYNGYNAYVTSQAPMYLGPDQSNPLYVSGNGVTFTITNNNYSAGFIQDYYMSEGSQVLYQEICLVCNQAGDTYETAKGNLGTQTHRWDVLWVDTAHYNTHPSDSSILVKHDIVNLRDVGEIIDNVRTVEFKYNNDSSDRTRFGLIYEELIKILPELCRQDDKTGEFGIEYDDFIAVLLKQAQESRKKEKELEDKVKSLEDRLERLEKLLIK